MTEFETRLQIFQDQLHTALIDAYRKVPNEKEWIESDEDVRRLGFRMWGIFVASICGELEEEIGRGSFASFIARLSDNPTPKKSSYPCEDMPTKSSPKGRARVMWAIRNAYVHGNGHIKRIDDEDVAAWLEPGFARKHLWGVRVEKGVVLVDRDVVLPVIQTAVEIYTKFK